MLGNLIVALGLATLQVVVLIGLSALRGGAFHITGAGVAWFAAAALLFTVFMYGVAETLASRVSKQEDYVGATPVLAILPFFFAGALYPIGAMPGALTAIAKAFPAHPRARADALRVHRPERQGAARHLGHAQRDPRGVAQPRRRGRVGGRAHRDLDPRIRALGRELSGLATRDDG